MALLRFPCLHTRHRFESSFPDPCDFAAQIVPAIAAAAPLTQIFVGMLLAAAGEQVGFLKARLRASTGL